MNNNEDDFHTWLRSQQGFTFKDIKILFPTILVSIFMAGTLWAAASKIMPEEEINLRFDFQEQKMKSMKERMDEGFSNIKKELKYIKKKI